MHLQLPHNAYLYSGLLILLLFVAILDLKTRKIPNAMTYSLMSIGIVLLFLPGFGIGIKDVIINTLLTILIFGYGFYKKQFGGGDFKLILAIGFYLKWVVFIKFLILMIAFGAVAAFMKSFKEIYKTYKASNMDIRYMSIDSVISLIKSSSSKKLAYGFCIFAGFLIIYLKEIISVI